MLVVEGITDVAAGIAHGWACVGRPSAYAGADLLAEILRDRKTVIVLGERDQKADGRWPGLDGARRIASQLAAHWCRSVRWELPPVPYKDLRLWLNSQMLRQPHRRSLMLKTRWIILIR